MSWSTIYIKGKIGHKKALLAKLDDSWPYGNLEPKHRLLTFWMKDDATLRDFKKAIGSKIIFKYRLKLFLSVEEYILSKNETVTGEELSSDEQDMVNKMVTWELANSKPAQNYSNNPLPKGVPSRTNQIMEQ